MNKAKFKKGQLHPRNKHQGRYDFPALVKACPELSKYLVVTPRGEDSINFSDPKSVMLLNKALLAYFYQIDFWQIPAGYLCPPIPGRVDYIHYLADLLAGSVESDLLTGSQIKGLDIGCGANCIYPILGARSYDWSFVGADIDALAVKTARLLVSSNVNLRNKVSIREQKEKENIFTGLVTKNDRFAFSMCNPPFHASMEEAASGTQLKLKNLNKKAKPAETNHKADKVTLNFAGQAHELSCAGGEIQFVKQMAKESLLFKHQICWFTCLISKSANLAPLKKLLEKQNVQQLKVVEMAQGQKISRFIAWTYLDQQQQKDFFA